MKNEPRYLATDDLANALTDMERSAAWLSRKIGVSQQFMSFVVRKERTIAESKARLATVALGRNEIDSFFVPVVTDVSNRGTQSTEQAA